MLLVLSLVVVIVFLKHDLLDVALNGIVRTEVSICDLVLIVGRQSDFLDEPGVARRVDTQ